MDIADLETIKKIGEEYGWSEQQLEHALANAIRLVYVERDELVEIDVNFDLGSITGRRRTGFGDHGTWTDIGRIMLPTTKQFIEVMEMMQWGDGAPGRIMEGEVAGFRDNGIIYRVQENLVYIPENLVSVMDFHDRPAIGTRQVVALCASLDPVSKMRVGSRRGKEFVLGVTEAYFSDCVTGLWMGASNSWAVIRMEAEDMSTWLENGGINVKHLQQVCGLRRITLLPAGKGEDEQECKDNEIKHFVNNAWKACKIAVLEPDRIVIHTPMDQQDPRKLRTFASMLKKIAPEREQILL
ncbi:MAG: hypothetical protein WAX89_05965 [Alphaproteobacteria bacterium]